MVLSSFSIWLSNSFKPISTLSLKILISATVVLSILGSFGAEASSTGLEQHANPKHKNKTTNLIIEKYLILANLLKIYGSRRQIDGGKQLLNACLLFGESITICVAR